MVRAARCGWLVVVLVLVGCAKDEDYMEVYREQRANYKELADILATIKDEKSLADAKSALDDRSKRFAAVARKANALPKPPPESVRKRLEDDAFTMRRTIEQLQDEINRVRRDVKGGEEFWKQFESISPGLLSTVQP